MNKELARTLTVALVSYLDENRPEGTMDCSSGECESIEKMFEGDKFDIIEAFIQKKLSRLTEFEKRVRFIMDEFSAGRYSADNINDVRGIAKGLLDIANKELPKAEELAKKHLDGYCLGREDALRNLKDLIESQLNHKKVNEFNTPTINIPTWEPPCYHGGPCTNPMRDCINCIPTLERFNTTSGTSTLKAKG